MTSTGKSDLSKGSEEGDGRDLHSELLARAMRLCASREYSVQDIELRLRKWGAHSGQVTEAITGQLVREGYIDEARFASAFVNDKLKYNRWGRVKIRYGLRSRGIDDDTAEQALSTIDEKLYREIAERHIAGILSSAKTSDPRALFAKVVRSMQSKGFEYPVIKEITEKLLGG